METSEPEIEVGSFVAELSFEDLSDSHVETIRRAFVDTIGVTVAGAVESAGEKLATTGGVVPEAADVQTVLGIEGPEQPAQRALRVGTASHALDYDDLSWGMDGHPSVTLVPPLLALVSEVDPSGEELLTAYAAGFETECAVATPISPEHYEAGWHATATFGTFGATAAVAHLLGLSAEETATALSLAASMPAGLKRNFGSMTKPLHAGLCARSGVTAGLLAREGLTAGEAPISGAGGFWELYGETEPAAFAIGDGYHLDRDGIHTKAYPCCYFTHAAIAATLDLAPEVEVTAVEHLTVEAAGGAGDALTNPDPETPLEAKFSMEYAVASALVRGRVDLDTFSEEALTDATVQRMRDVVDFSVDDSLDYDAHEAYVRIETTDGSYERRRHDPPGTHDDPLGPDETRAKFEECVGRAFDEERSAQLYETCATLPQHRSVQAALSEL